VSTNGEGNNASRRTRKVLIEKQVNVPDILAQATAEMNAGQFFECHETLEELWQQERGPIRNFYKGLIHVAVAFVHIGRGNYYGANRLFRTARQYLEPYYGLTPMGFDADQLRLETRAAHDVLIGLGKTGIRNYDLDQTPKFRFDPARVRDEARRWRAWGFDINGDSRIMTITVAEAPV
jgi:hypothetical protein